MVYKVKLHDKDTFLQHRLEQESKISETMDSTNPLTSILTIELSTTELCNRTCVFCPRHDPKVYPNRNLHMSVEDAEMISKNIGSDFKGKISLTGFSENFLNKNFHDIIKVMRKNLSNSIFECNTNGDFLTEEYAKKLFINGLDLLYINLYDGLEQIEKFTKIMKNAKIDESKYSFRAHYSQKNYGLKNLIEGEFTKDQKVVLIEDVITTGSSIFESAKNLEDNGLVVSQIISIFSRSDNLNLQYNNIPIQYLYHSNELNN